MCEQHKFHLWLHYMLEYVLSRTYKYRYQNFQVLNSHTTSVCHGPSGMASAR